MCPLLWNFRIIFPIYLENIWPDGIHTRPVEVNINVIYTEKLVYHSLSSRLSNTLQAIGSFK